MTGTDQVTLQDTSGATTLNTSSSGYDISNVNATHADRRDPFHQQRRHELINVSAISPHARPTASVRHAIAGALTVRQQLRHAEHRRLPAKASGLDQHPLLSTALTGLARATVSYSHLVNLALNIGTSSAADTFTIASTASGTTTSLNTGPGNDTINVRSHQFSAYDH